MTISVGQLVAIGIIAAWAGIEGIIDEFQIHRPLVACTLIGLVLGNVKTAIVLGGTLELMVLGWMNIGAAISPDSALASIIAAILVISSKQDIGTGIAIAVPIAAAGQVLTILVRTISIGIQHKADEYASTGNLRGIDICHLSALALQALRVAVPSLLVAMVSADKVKAALELIPEFITKGLQISGGFIVVVGYAMVMNMMGVKYLMSFFFLGFVIAAFTNFNLVAIGIVGVALAIIYIQLNPKYHVSGISKEDIDDL